MAYCAYPIHWYMSAHIYNDVLIAFFKLRFLSLAFVLSTKSPKINFLKFLDLNSYLA